MCFRKFCFFVVGSQTLMQQLMAQKDRRICRWIPHSLAESELLGWPILCNYSLQEHTVPGSTTRTITGIQEGNAMNAGGIRTFVMAELRKQEKQDQTLNKHHLEIDVGFGRYLNIIDMTCIYTVVVQSAANL